MAIYAKMEPLLLGCELIIVLDEPRLTSSRNDNMAAYVGTNTRRFIDMFHDNVDEFQRNMIEYISTLLRPTTRNPDTIR
jgi:hypothetical protein